MKPDTVELFTCLACAEAKKAINELVNLDAATLDASELREYATSCADIISIFEALENLLLTAADELETVIRGVDLAAEAFLAGDPKAEPVGILNDIHHPGIGFHKQNGYNIAVMTKKEHAKRILENKSGEPENE